MVPRDMTSQEGLKSCGVGLRVTALSTVESFFQTQFYLEVTPIQIGLVVGVFETNSETKLNNTSPFMAFIQIT